jgi:eukaryotic-like serine/threonine-protein kinase
MTTPIKAGEVLAGKFQIERVLGAGGMGVVVAARHMHLDERVAIKYLQPEALSEPGLVQRFLREGRAAAKIKSEHVARVYDVGTFETGAPYLVMEYLEGSDLSAMLKQRGPLPLDLAVEYMLQACEAIAEAHVAGIVHRDLKPSNLFLTSRADGSAVVKVIDFGISKVTTGADAGMDITKTAEMRGSLLFMPPEQMSRPRDADPRSDIWAIGVSLYNLITGTFPFWAETMPQLCAKVFHEEPDPPRVHRAGIPEGLEGAILRCLRRNVSQRFASVADLAAALAPFAGLEGRMSAERISRTLRTGRATQPSAPESTAGMESAPRSSAPSAPVSSRSEPRALLHPPPVAPVAPVAPEPPQSYTLRSNPGIDSAALLAASAATTRVQSPPSSTRTDSGALSTPTGRSAWGLTKPLVAGVTWDRLLVPASIAGVLAVIAIVVVTLSLQKSSPSSSADASSSSAVDVAPAPTSTMEPRGAPSASAGAQAMSDKGTAQPSLPAAPQPSAAGSAEPAKLAGSAAPAASAGQATTAAPTPGPPVRAPAVEKPKGKRGLFDSPL